MDKYPFVSIIIPCLNEEKFIGMCLDSILANDYPKDRLEVLVVDGMSEDGTRMVVESYIQKYPWIRLVDNPKRIIPAAMNIGIKYALGDIIMPVSAHSTYPSDYVSKCVRYLEEYGADNVGGVLKIMPREDTLIAKTIALALAHPFGSGNAYVKVGSRKPRWADTAAFGCYRKETLQKLGPYDEEKVGSEDMDLNLRLRKAGGKILLAPDIVINYYADSDLRTLWRHNFADGVWVTYPLKFKSAAFSIRHLVPLMFVIGVTGSGLLSLFLPPFRWLFGGTIGVYTLANLVSSVHLAIQARSLSYLFTAPFVFAVRHLAYGAGALLGLLLALIPGEHWKGRRSKNV